ncbi:hypothetical protein [Streptomyces exfoliatus]|uniref:hypothetical protein n=1 Tax=Streptomyces exfoliatus TaxID=1905 RepID=UPI000464F958|nr:hypothetical protein [Streptomyces exfoliatus]
MDKPPAPEVQISVPPEQARLTAALTRLVKDTGLGESRWLLFPESAFRRRVERYLDGTFIPTDSQLITVGSICLEVLGTDDDEVEQRLLELLHLAEDARAARARDRRIARQQR